VTTPYIVNFTKKHRLNWYGHTVRMIENSVVKMVLKSDFLKKRNIHWIDQIQDVTGLIEQNC